MQAQVEILDTSSSKVTNGRLFSAKKLITIDRLDVHYLKQRSGSDKHLHQVIVRDIVSENPPIFKYQSKRFGIAPLLFYNPNFEPSFSKGLILRQLHFATCLEQEVSMAQQWQLYYDRNSKRFKGQAPVMERPSEYTQDLVLLTSSNDVDKLMMATESTNSLTQMAIYQQHWFVLKHNNFVDKENHLATKQLEAKSMKEQQHGQCDEQPVANSFVKNQEHENCKEGEIQENNANATWNNNANSNTCIKVESSQMKQVQFEENKHKQLVEKSSSTAPIITIIKVPQSKTIDLIQKEELQSKNQNNMMSSESDDDSSDSDDEDDQESHQKPKSNQLGIVIQPVSIAGGQKSLVYNMSLVVDNRINMSVSTRFRRDTNKTPNYFTDKSAIEMIDHQKNQGQVYQDEQAFINFLLNPLNSLPIESKALSGTSSNQKNDDDEKLKIFQNEIEYIKQYTDKYWKIKCKHGCRFEVWYKPKHYPKNGNSSQFTNIEYFRQINKNHELIKHNKLFYIKSI